jgi:hypothetical protein
LPCYLGVIDGTKANMKPDSCLFVLNGLSLIALLEFDLIVGGQSGCAVGVHDRQAMK